MYVYSNDRILNINNSKHFFADDVKTWIIYKLMKDDALEERISFVK